MCESNTKVLSIWNPMFYIIEISFMNSIGSDSLKYQRFTRPSCKDLEIKKFEFVARF